jgi:hypothetical protein
MDTLNETLEEIERCDKCCNIYPNYAESLDPRKKACTEFRVFEDWVPDKVRTLFIAESPSWRKPAYFYNEGVEDSLRASLLGILKIGDLKEFEDRGNFLIDVVKCRFNKRGRSIPKTIIHTCSRSYLRREIDAVKPEKIFVLGKTALTGLQTIFRDSSLGKYKSMIESCGTELNVSGYNVIISLYPSDQNRRYYHEMKEAFKKLTRK